MVDAATLRLGWLPVANNGDFPSTSPTNKKDAASVLEYRVLTWWSDGDLTPGPSACKADARVSVAVSRCRLPHSNEILDSVRVHRNAPTYSRLAT